MSKFEQALKPYLEWMEKRMERQKEKEIRLFKYTEHPEKAKDFLGNNEEFSVDVVCINPDGMINVGFWNYKDEQWKFHSDALYSLDDIPFIWHYPIEYKEL